jgi:hypothetical protein
MNSQTPAEAASSMIRNLARQMAEQPDQVLPRLVHLAMELAAFAGLALKMIQDASVLRASGFSSVFRRHCLSRLLIVAFDLRE